MRVTVLRKFQGTNKASNKNCRSLKYPEVEDNRVGKKWNGKREW